MRDIRKDLLERLEATTAARRKLEVELAAVQMREAGIKSLLKQEEEHFANQHIAMFAEGESSPSLAQLILQIIKSKKRPLDLGEIKEEIAKTHFDFGEKAPGRAIHFALVGMDQTGTVERLSDKRWAIKPDKEIPVQEMTQ